MLRASLLQEVPWLSSQALDSCALLCLSQSLLQTYGAGDVGIWQGASEAAGDVKTPVVMPSRARCSKPRLYSCGDRVSGYASLGDFTEHFVVDNSNHGQQ